MMNKKILATGMLGLLLSMATAHAQQKDWAGLQRYEQANRELMQDKSSGKRVVFMGNSITEGWERCHPAFFTDNAYICRGISGQTSYQYLVRFRSDVIDLAPAVVVINAGTNDIAENTGPYNEDRTLGNILSMVELAQAHRIQVVLTTTLPAASFGWNPSITDAPQKIKQLNARLKEYARVHRIPFVDYYSSMVSGEECALHSAYTKDGVHPTAEGYDVMEALIQKTLKKMLRRK